MQHASLIRRLRKLYRNGEPAIAFGHSWGVFVRANLDALRADLGEPTRDDRAGVLIWHVNGVKVVAAACVHA